MSEVQPTAKVMTGRFRPFPPTSGRYGAAMGRYSAGLDADDVSELSVAGPAGEYDAGGAYWGLGGSEGPVWAVWVTGRGREGVAYVRAKGREEAKRKALE